MHLSRFLKAFFPVILLAVSFCLGMPSRIAFTNTDAKTNYFEYYIPKKTIKKIFNKRSINRDVLVKVKIPTAILSEVFTNLEMVVSLANKYARQKFQVKLAENEIEKDQACFWAFDGYKTYAYIYPLLEDNSNPEDAHFVYYCTGKYQGKVSIKGFFILDMRIRRHEARSVVDIKFYFQLANPFISFVTYFLRKENDNFNLRLERLIDSTIQHLVAVGKKTAYGYYTNVSRKKKSTLNSVPGEKP